MQSKFFSKNQNLFKCSMFKTQLRGKIKSISIVIDVSWNHYRYTTYKNWFSLHIINLSLYNLWPLILFILCIKFQILFQLKIMLKQLKSIYFKVARCEMIKFWVILKRCISSNLLFLSFSRKYYHYRNC